MLTEQIMANSNSQRRISAFTIQRLFLYYRALLESRETDIISSYELAQLTGFTAAQIRKDLSYFGEFGIPGKGYNVKKLRHQIKNILGIDREWEVALVGIGNLGRALLTYPNLTTEGFKITYLFDNDPYKIGKYYAGIKIEDIKTVKQKIQNNQIKMAVVTVPVAAGKEVIDLLVEAGVKTILNFVPTKVIAPEGVKILNIDITNEMARLSYYMTQLIPMNMPALADA